ncbi:hypothetical protein TSTA_074640 [Talaromyces stipitatus ATCC 10500]|uniref:Uncharacterized protein n=1 Tax=Talaromyces stipitatus (strain ATCC 10500 / CBS 375.48 / QM 6759 / NRRL 1006) TaxID=441959 RepID=B8LW58_TALSN|nr:uncharacterized protein TSTA_074640 [Talaromyces stipitatus ATCC 10500]EED24086.1 hypothetical protein TSTA_074640 [Talaromyces stipitatus ATCC 10500]
MTFWKNWESWEKMVFVNTRVFHGNHPIRDFKVTRKEHVLTTIATRQAGVIITGGWVAWMNRRKLKLYNQASADEVNRQARVSGIPFGARALESGVHIDGIYTPGRYIPRQGLSRQTSVVSPVSNSPLTPLTPTVTRASSV